ncbi:S-adenosyl-L-methionine-dependent methyltransferase [Corynespora cassiicola Philippines]|uniref:S-adenosyl-L-methionine-dependent methyltransferase n=1 Tax=Corynespora cassiicola Philippines TaxID=1448308 RepID=A0A2T2NIG7_CORCC|nr:S-adenosyl-L-methionine-dependent methyltransferase [Corynespora cassiicola Philippines]
MTTSLVQIAREILRNAEIIESFTGGNSNSEATRVPADLEKARVDLVDAAQAIRSQALSPETLMFQTLWAITDLPVLRFVYTYNLPQYIPLGDSISYKSVAKASGIDERLLVRFIRYAITINIFTEPSTGYVTHSPISKMLKTNPSALDVMGMILEELGPSVANVMTAKEKFANIDPQAEEPTSSGYNVANETDLPIYQFLDQHPNRASRFGDADTKYLLEAFPWSSFDRKDVLMVDVGGSHGGVSYKVAEATSEMHFLIQDLESVVQVGKSVLPESLKDRVSFMSHDFFTPQTVKADIYFFRWIFHNWSDKYSIRILQSLIPAMNSGAKILLYEHVLDDGSDTRTQTKNDRYYPK